MNPAELIQERDTLRSQLRDAREQAARDSATIARVTAERDDRRASLAQEIAEALKSRGFWTPQDTASSDLICAVARAAEEAAALRARVAELERWEKAALIQEQNSGRWAEKCQQAEQHSRELTDACRYWKEKYEANEMRRVGDVCDALDSLRKENAKLEKEEAESRRLFYAEQDKRQSAEYRIEELVAALRGVVGWANPHCAHEALDYENARCVLARAESAAPAKRPDTEALDWLLSDVGSLWVYDMLEHGKALNRDRLYAARKQGGPTP